MKTATTSLALVVTLGMLASSSIGCSSSSEKEDVDTASAISELRSPTGTFSEANAAKAFGGYRSDRANSSKVAAPGLGSAGGSSTQSIRLLDSASSAQSGCGANQPCACPNGGSLTYQAGSSPDGQLVRVTFDACGFEDGWGFDGKAILLASNKSLLGLDEPAASTPTAPKKPATGFGGEDDTTPDLREADDSGYGSGAKAFLVAAKGTATDGKRSLALSFALLRESPYSFLAVSVPDGKIVIGVSDDGRAIVRSKEGTWRCQSGARGWTCTSDKGQKMEVAEDADGATASNDSVTPPSDGPSEGIGAAF